MKKDILNNVSRTFSKVKFNVKKHSPEILIVTGVIGVVTSTVIACKATTKVGKVADDHKKQIKEVHEAIEKGVTKAGEAYNEEDRTSCSRLFSRSSVNWGTEPKVTEGTP